MEGVGARAWYRWRFNSQDTTLNKSKQGRLVSVFDKIGTLHMTLVRIAIGIAQSISTWNRHKLKYAAVWSATLQRVHPSE
jgi:hypothetical protein